MDFYAIMENNTGMQEGMNDYGVSYTLFTTFCFILPVPNRTSYVKVINHLCNLVVYIICSKMAVIRESLLLYKLKNNVKESWTKHSESCAL